MTNLRYCIYCAVSHFADVMTVVLTTTSSFSSSAVKTSSDHILLYILRNNFYNAAQASASALTWLQHLRYVTVRLLDRFEDVNW